MLLKKGAVALSLLFLSQGLMAAQQGEGTLTLAERTLEFSNATPAVGANLTTDPARSCVEGALPCDQYALGVALPDDLTDYFPAAQVKIYMDATGPTGQDDIDLYLLDADGNQLQSSGNFQSPEFISFLADGGSKNFIVEVQLYIALGATYNLNISLDLGEANPEFTELEVSEWLADNGASFSRSDELLASCQAPGVTVLTDAEGDGGLTLVPYPGTDLLQADIYQTTDADGAPEIVITLKVDDLSSPLPQSVYFVSFQTYYGDVRGVRMEVDSEGTASFWSYLVGEDSDGDREGHFVESAKPARAASHYTADGLITWHVSPDDLVLLLPGDTLSGFNAGATSFVGVEGAGISFNNDAMPDGLARQGEFEYLAAEDCMASSRSRVIGAEALSGRGGALGWFLVMLGMLQLARRR